MARCFVSRSSPASIPDERYCADQPESMRERTRVVIPLTDGEMDASVLAQTYRAQAPSLLRYFKRKTRNIDDATDLMQEAFARLIAQMRKTPLAHPASYLQRIARNLLVDRIRLSKREEAALGWRTAEASEVSVAPEQALAIEGEDALRLYRQAVDALPQKTRQVFIMQRAQGMTYKQIAEQLGISIPTVQYHFGRALAQIAQALDGDDVR